MRHRLPTAILALLLLLVPVVPMGAQGIEVTDHTNALNMFRQLLETIQQGAREAREAQENIATLQSIVDNTQQSLDRMEDLYRSTQLFLSSTEMGLSLLSSFEAGITEAASLGSMYSDLYAKDKISLQDFNAAMWRVNSVLGYYTSEMRTISVMFSQVRNPYDAWDAARKARSDVADSTAALRQQMIAVRTQVAREQVDGAEQSFSDAFNRSPRKKTRKGIRWEQYTIGAYISKTLFVNPLMIWRLFAQSNRYYTKGVITLTGGKEEDPRGRLRGMGSPLLNTLRVVLGLFFLLAVGAATYKHFKGETQHRDALMKVCAAVLVVAVAFELLHWLITNISSSL